MTRSKPNPSTASASAPARSGALFPPTCSRSPSPRWTTRWRRRSSGCCRRASRRSDSGYVATACASSASPSPDSPRERWGWQVDPAGHPDHDRRERLHRRGAAPGDRARRRRDHHLARCTRRSPTWSPEAGGTRRSTCRCIDDGWRLRPRRASRRRFAAGGARAMLLSNPHNPLGLPATRPSHSRALADLAAAHEATVVERRDPRRRCVHAGRRLHAVPVGVGCRARVGHRRHVGEQGVQPRRASSAR